MRFDLIVLLVFLLCIAISDYKSITALRFIDTTIYTFPSTLRFFYTVLKQISR